MHFDFCPRLLGFDFLKRGTKRHLLITFLILKEWRPISSVVKNVVKTLPEKTLRKKNSYLHANYEIPVTIKRLLRGLAIKDIKIATMHLDELISIMDVRTMYWEVVCVE